MTATVAPQSAARPPRRTSDTRGKIVHNLLVVYDSGWKDEKGEPYAEFRVQCEVLLSVDEANAVVADLSKRSDTSLAHAQDIVLKRVNPLATELFKQTVRSAFQDNQDNIGLVKVQRGSAVETISPKVHSRRISDILGKIVHNLVVVYDSGWKDEKGEPYAEFRVQCEVLLPVDEANAVVADLSKRSDTSLAHAQDIVVKRVNPLATELFKQTVRSAFQDNQTTLGL